MKLNNKGFLITGILYSLLLLFLVLILGMVAILNARQNKLDYISKDIITKLNDKYDFDVAKVWEFDYTGNYQTFTVPTDGYYEIELWGAQGGSMSGTGYTSDGTSRGQLTYTGGKGAYTKGIIYLTKGENIYIYVGGKGSDNISHDSTCSTRDTSSGGYNGGGSLNTVGDPQCRYGGSGGGATDIRLVDGVWNNFDSLKSRIMVAAGGGGANFRNKGFGEGNGGAGGAFYGVDGQEALTEGSYFRSDYSPGYNIGLGGTQTYVGANEQHLLDGTITRYYHSTNSFGVINYDSQSGGGGGYYPGSSTGHGGAGGGSSFVSGLYGCNAIAEASTSDAIVHTDQPNHYSGKVFYNGMMIAGDASMPTHEGTSTMIGNEGNGYAKISLMSSNPDSYTITNMLVNGGFENNTENWSKKISSQKFEIDATKSYIGNNSIKVTALSDKVSMGIVYSTGFNTELNHIYYSSAYVANPYSHGTVIRNGYKSSTDTDGTRPFGAYITHSNTSISNTDSFKRLSIYYTFSKKTADFDNGIATSYTSIWSGEINQLIDEYFNVDAVLTVDLTKTFGPGNEPTKEWCDENISYFDGEITIYK